MKLKLTTLCDNLSGHLNFTAAWGLSVLVECVEQFSIDHVEALHFITF